MNRSKTLSGSAKKDIREMAGRVREAYPRRKGRIPFGLRRIKLLIGVMHWVQGPRTVATGMLPQANIADAKRVLER